MAKTEILDNFQVSTWISSDNKEVHEIDEKTANTVHVIQVDNTSTVRRDARVVGALPNGTSSLIFDDGQTRNDRWSKEIKDILTNEVRAERCSLERVSAALVQEPVRCEEVSTKKGNGNWVPEKGNGNIPFGVYIRVK